MDLAAIRNDYRRGRLRRDDLAPEPFTQFGTWMNEAITLGVVEPTAMTLGTVSPEGVPSLRTVLLKGVDPAEGFVFYTNLKSRKAGQLEATGRASLLFPWLAVERQVMVIGKVTSLSRERVATYFASRPRESQLAAWASHQSREIAARAVLEERLAEVSARFEEGAVPLPDFWGGFVVEPQSVEFWQGGAHRLHDRFEYRRAEGAGGGWTLHRLSP